MTYLLPSDEFSAWFFFFRLSNDFCPHKMSTSFFVNFPFLFFFFFFPVQHLFPSSSQRFYTHTHTLLVLPSTLQAEVVSILATLTFLHLVAIIFNYFCSSSRAHSIPTLASHSIFTNHKIISVSVIHI